MPSSSTRLAGSVALAAFVSLAPASLVAQRVTGIDPEPTSVSTSVPVPSSTPAVAVTIRSGEALFRLRPEPDGRVAIDAQQGADRVLDQFDTAALLAWADRTSKLLDVRTAGESGPPNSVVDAFGRKRSEYVGPWLYAARGSALVVDRMEQDGLATLDLYLTDADGDHQMYVGMTAESVSQFLSAMRDVAARAEQEARTAASVTPPQASPPTGRPR